METQTVFRLFLLLLLLIPCCYAQTVFEGAKPRCKERCGNINIPYPFGIGNGCFLPGFRITCNELLSPPTPFVGRIPVIQISQGSMLVNVITEFLPYDCYDPSGARTGRQSGTFNLSGTPLTFSDPRNKFTVIGCDTVAYITNKLNSSTGCLSLCGVNEMVIDGKCYGTGCCTANIGKGLQYFKASISSFYHYTRTSDSRTSDNSSCSYAYLLDQEHFNFSRSDLKGFRSRTDLSVSLEWAIGNETCADAEKNRASFACKANNSTCVPSFRDSGYLCNCSQGYSGNPYLVDGCQDVNECLDPNANSCLEMAKCVNTPGSYFCECPTGTQGDGVVCTKNIDQFFLKVILGSGSVLLFLLVSGSWTYWGMRKRNLIRLREKFFRQNGGLLLQQKSSSSSHGGGTANVRIFTPEELKDATNNYDNSHVLGTGGFGTVYKGNLKDGTTVAIKVSKVVSEAQIEQFINEVIIVSQINHRNVVKLLGCCFETQIPILVYEFISNGNLSDHIHGSNGIVSRIPWYIRMRIATETAEALAYLHSAASVPIFHMDIKPVNILLDENYTAKVADFGASRLVPLDDEAKKLDYIQGTLGYLDPEYFQSYCSTDKSDVYSFGVVLAELLTGRKKPTVDFLSAVKENRLEQILEAQVLEEGTLQELQAVSNLARRCLRLNGEERPTMKEVAQELGWIKGIELRPWVHHNEEETELLLGDFQTEFMDLVGQDSSHYTRTFSIEIGVK